MILQSSVLHECAT